MRRITLTLIILLSIAVISKADEVVEMGKRITLDYRLLVNGQLVESKSLVAVLGKKQVIPGLEKDMLGMKGGEEREFDIQPKDAYGNCDSKAVKSFPLNSLPEQRRIVGAVIKATAPDGTSFPATVKTIENGQATLDFNHPLCGKVLHFWVKIKSINSGATPGVIQQTNTETLEDKLKNLNKLLTDGLITKDEFETQKKALIDNYIGK
jgi:FKBP-type peptidyl-prolyl cis-trans isomerase 2